MNYIGIKTLMMKELKRSLRVPIQVFGSPLIQAFLFFVVFGFSIGDRIGTLGGLSYKEFIMPGLIMMNVLTTTFSSVASAFMLAKVMNVLSDILLAPLSENDLILGFSIASALRGILTALLIWLVALFFIPLEVVHPLYLLSFLMVVSLIFSVLGLMAGVWAETFEQMNLFPTFLITPLSFLGGVFYSIDILPEALQTITRWNPFFYLINGMRYGFYGVSDVNPVASYAVVAVILVLVWFAAWYMLKKGYKIRS